MVPSIIVEEDIAIFLFIISAYWVETPVLYCQNSYFYLSDLSFFCLGAIYRFGRGRRIGSAFGWRYRAGALVCFFYFVFIFWSLVAGIFSPVLRFVFITTIYDYSGLISVASSSSPCDDGKPILVKRAEWMRFSGVKAA